MKGLNNNFIVSLTLEIKATIFSFPAYGYLLQLLYFQLANFCVNIFGTVIVERNAPVMAINI